MHNLYLTSAASSAAAAPSYFCYGAKVTATESEKHPVFNTFSQLWVQEDSQYTCTCTQNKQVYEVLTGRL